MSTITVHAAYDSYVAIRRTRPVPRSVPRPVAAPARHPRGQVRLTRRGKLVVLLVALTAVLAAALFWGASSVATESGGEPTPSTIVTVGPGDTLWGLAAAVTPAGEDVRDTVALIERLNALDTVLLDAGQRLRVPVGP